MSNFHIAGFGDSLTWFNPGNNWCDQLVSPHTCDSFGVPGERTLEGSNRLVQMVDSLDPWTTHVTLFWGANDMGVPGMDYLNRFEIPLRAAVDAVLGAGFEPVLVVQMEIYHGSEPWCRPFDFLNTILDTEISPRIYDIADDYTPPIKVVDLNAAYDAVPVEVKCPLGADLGNINSPFYYWDHVHQTIAGNAFIAETVVDEIEGVPVPGLEGVAWYLAALLFVLIGGLGSGYFCRRRGG
jgi:lysophospholipase L1-like esterase